MIKYDTTIFFICNSLFNKIPSMHTVYNMMTILIRFHRKGSNLAQHHLFTYQLSDTTCSKQGLHNVD